MIITCASCLTKFNLDDARIPPKGAKVRCSRCRHIFYVLPAFETKEEAGYGDYHEVLPEPGRKEVKLPLQIEEEEGMAEPLLSEMTLPLEPEKKEREEKKKEEKKGKVFTAKKAAQRDRKGPSLFFIVFAIVVLLVFIAFYLLGEFGSEGKLIRYLEYPIKKITELFH